MLFPQVIYLSNSSGFCFPLQHSTKLKHQRMEMWLGSTSASNVNEKRMQIDNEIEEGEIVENEEDEIVKCLMQDFQTWKDDNVLLALVEDQLEEGEFVPEYCQQQVLKENSTVANLKDRDNGVAIMESGSQSCSLNHKLVQREDFEEHEAPPFVSEAVQGRMHGKFPRPRMSKIQYLNKLMGTRRAGCTNLHKRPSKRMSKTTYLKLLPAADQKFSGGCEKQDSLDVRGGFRQSVQQSVDNWFVDEPSSVESKSTAVDRVNSKGNLGERYVVTDNSFQQSVGNNVSQSDFRSAESSSKSDKEIRYCHGKMGVKHMNLGSQISMKRSVTEKSNGRMIVQALMAAPNCLWRGGNRTLKPSINCSQCVRKCGEKKCDSRLPTMDAKKHNIHIGEARAKVEKARSLFRSVFKALVLQQNDGNSSNVTGKKINRFDLLSATILKRENYWVNSGKQIVGTVPGVEVGDVYHYRVELAIVGLHRQYESGIDYVNEDGRILAASIVASGVYADYMYNSDVLIYCGQGGNPQRERDSKIANDQKLERGNLALKNSMLSKTPVRVIRGFNEAKGHQTLLARLETDATLVYDGLYMVERFWEEQGVHRNIIFKYQLTRIPGQPAIKLFKTTNRDNFL